MVSGGQEILGQPRGSALVPDLTGHSPIPGEGNGLRLHVHRLYHWVAPADMGFPLMAVIIEIQKEGATRGGVLEPEVGSQELSPRPVEKGRGQDSAHCLFHPERESFVPLAYATGPFCSSPPPPP